MQQKVLPARAACIQITLLLSVVSGLVCLSGAKGQQLTRAPSITAAFVFMRRSGFVSLHLAVSSCGKDCLIVGKGHLRSGGCTISKRWICAIASTADRSCFYARIGSLWFGTDKRSYLFSEQMGWMVMVQIERDRLCFHARIGSLWFG